MKKTVLISVISLLFLCTSVAQVRNYVGSIQLNHNPETVSMLEIWQAGLKADGYEDLSEQVENYLKTGGGSGFAYVDSQGKNYIITSSYGISAAETCSVRFEKIDGDFVTYDDLSVLYKDEDLGLALLAFPETSAPFSEGLSFISENLGKDTPVWSAGYLTLNNKYLWFLGEGIIFDTESVAPVNASKFPVIQHSAAVTLGNSGGPLLKENTNEPTGYEVAGVNILWDYDDFFVNYAIPAKVVLSIIERGLEQNNSVENASLEKTAESFVAVINEPNSYYSELKKYITNDYIAVNDINFFLDAIRTTSSQVQIDVLSTFAASPIEGVRLAKAYDIWQKMHPDVAMDGTDVSTRKVSVASVSEKPDGAFTTLVCATESNVAMEFTWIHEDGSWRITSGIPVSLTDNEKDTQKERNVEFFAEEGFILLGTYNVGLGSKVTNMVGLDFSGSLSFIRFGVTIGYGTGVRYNNENPIPGSDFKLSCYGEIPFPISINKVMITPFLRGIMDVVLFNDKSTDPARLDIGAAWSGGLRVGYIFEPVGVYVNIAYEGLITGLSGESISQGNIHGLNISLGISF